MKLKVKLSKSAIKTHFENLTGKFSSYSYTWESLAHPFVTIYYVFNTLTYPTILKIYLIS